MREALWFAAGFVLATGVALAQGFPTYTLTEDRDELTIGCRVWFEEGDPCRADLTQDGIVGMPDFNLLAGFWDEVCVE